MNCIPHTEQLLKIRSREILVYLRFLRVAVEKNSTLSYGSTHRIQHAISRELTNTLKANLYLLLYNAMEAIFIKLIDEIHDVIGRKNVNIDELCNQLFFEVIRSFKNSNTDISNDIEAPLNTTIMEFWKKEWEQKVTSKEKRKGTISGNVDGKQMQEHLRRYGVVPKDEKKVAARLTHKALQLTKNRRNLLAHGEQGFAEFGMNLSVEELITDARSVFKTLTYIAIEVNKYLSAQGYLKSSSWNST